jgi:spore coat polysaccharide biosynthesis protein SpsF
MILQHVVDQALSAKTYVERRSSQKTMKTVVAVLHPTDDAQLVTTFKQCGAMLIAGDEQDVLSRFVKAQELTNADYIVRLTSDCPLILDFIISKHINVAVLNDLDYVSNVDEQVRLVFDGMDCEILSKNALKWLDVNAKSKEHREHVTLALRQNHPKEIKFGFVSQKLDSSNMKLSLDTPEDLERIRAYYHEREHKMSLAIRKFGRRNVFDI